MKKLSYVLILGSMFIYTTSYASLVPLGSGRFMDGNISINYPCSQGGEPLVIYSSSLNDRTPISSKATINPLYIKNGYSASPLEVSDVAQSDYVSPNYLMIQTPSPTTHFHSVSFSLNRTDHQDFYVSTVNLAAIYSRPEQQFVSSYQVIVDKGSSLEKIYQNINPYEMRSMDQDLGVLIFHNVKTLDIAQYAWNQLGKWSSYKSSFTYPVSYYFKPQKSDIPDLYNGFGFWVCGVDSEVMAGNVHREKGAEIYRDQITPASVQK